MHKKSVEAAATLETEEALSGTEQKSDSIASLRARAKEHNAKIRTALCGNDSLIDHDIKSMHGEFKLVWFKRSATAIDKFFLSLY